MFGKLEVILGHNFVDSKISNKKLKEYMNLSNSLEYILY
jgi:hypothetical protein